MIKIYEDIFKKLRIAFSKNVGKPGGTLLDHLFMNSLWRIREARWGRLRNFFLLAPSSRLCSALEHKLRRALYKNVTKEAKEPQKKVTKA